MKEHPTHDFHDFHNLLDGTCENVRAFSFKPLYTIFLPVATSCALAGGVAVSDITGCIVVG